MSDQRIGRLGQMREHRIVHRLADERLTRRIYVLAADLEEAVFLAEGHQTRQLFLRIARRHIGDRVEAQPLQLADQQIEIIILEFLRLFVARDRIAHVAEIGIGRDRAAGFADRNIILDVRAFDGGGNIEFFHQIRLQHAENIIFIKLRRFKPGEQLSARLGREGQAHFGFQKFHQPCRVGIALGELLCQREKDMPLCDRAALPCAGQRKHIPFEIERDAIGFHQLVDPAAHLQIALVAAAAVGLKEGVQHIYVLVGNAVHGHICDRILIGIVDSSSGDLGL